MEWTPQLADLDERLVRAARGIKVLSRLAWPAGVLERFLEGWRAGRPALPEPPPVAAPFEAEAAELRAIRDATDPGHPAGDWLRRTARSYLGATELLAAAGTPAFVERSRKLYGGPRDPVAGADTAPAVVAARKLLEASDGFVAETRLDEETYCLRPETVAAELRRRAAETFGDEPVEIVVDPDLPAKAAAGARRIRIRGATAFSEADVPQLVQHELLVHTLTALNGVVQPRLKSLSLGAPRTTRSQEGLALFAELVTNSIDVDRLRRIAARVVAIDDALEGADFLDVFRGFLAGGQTEREAAASAARVFRGGDPRGRVAFTKDAVYFQGLVRAHDFLRDAVETRRVDRPARAMAGRLHFADLDRLAPCFESGLIAPARFLPDWIRTRSRLVAFLLYSSLGAELQLDAWLGRVFAEADSDEAG